MRLRDTQFLSLGALHIDVHAMIAIIGSLTLALSRPKAMGSFPMATFFRAIGIGEEYTPNLL